jgi:hypothetical protein
MTSLFKYIVCSEFQPSEDSFIVVVSMRHLLSCFLCLDNAVDSMATTETSALEFSQSSVRKISEYAFLIK